MRDMIAHGEFEIWPNPNGQDVLIKELDLRDGAADLPDGLFS
jgi:hypothetical protein